MSELKKPDQLEAWAEELIDWQHGTVHKQYDREETTEALADDVRERLPALKALISQRCQDANREQFDQLWKALYPRGVEAGPNVVALLTYMNELQAKLSRRDEER